MTSRKRALVKAADVVAPTLNEEAMFVKLPISPEVAARVRTHIDAIRELVGLAVDANQGARGFLRRCFDVAIEIERDVKRVRGAAARRKPRRRRRS